MKESNWVDGVVSDSSSTTVLGWVFYVMRFFTIIFGLIVVKNTSRILEQFRVSYEKIDDLEQLALCLDDP